MATRKDKRIGKLPAAINSVNPKQKAGAKKIVMIEKQNGKVTGYKLSGGQMVTKAKGIQMAKSGKIKGVGVAKRNGTEYLRSMPTSGARSNLSKLPSTSKTGSTSSKSRTRASY